MELIVNFLLLAASGAACFYCWVLSARLKSLTSTRDGLQTGIAALSQSAEDMQQAMDQTKTVAGASISRLEELLAEADKRIPELRDMLQEITSISAQAVNDTELAAKNLAAVLAPQIKEARESAMFLLDSLEAAREPVVEAMPAGEHRGHPSAFTEDLEEDDFEYVAISDDENDSAAKGEAA